MTLLVYKGFGIDFLEQLEERPLVDGDIASKIDVFSFSKKTRKTLERELLDLEDDDKAWITYQEYSLIKSRVDDAVSEDGLEVMIYRNKLTFLKSLQQKSCVVWTVMIWEHSVMRARNFSRFITH